MERVQQHEKGFNKQPASITLVSIRKGGRETNLAFSEDSKRLVRYATSLDSTSIAYWSIGSGPPLLYAIGGPWNQLELWTAPECQHWYERLTENRRVIRYDMRGTGLSQRDVSNFSLDAEIEDLEAVSDSLGFEGFDLFGGVGGAPIALAFAAKYPERVGRLIIWCGWARAADVVSAKIRAWSGLIEQDWDLLAETCAQLVLGWSGGDLGRLAAENLKGAITPAVMQAALAATRQFDVTPLLENIKAPTLVLHRDNVSWIPVSVAQELTSQVPNSHLIVLEGESPTPYLGDMEGVIQVIDEFLAEGKVEGQPVAPSYPDGLTRREVEVLQLVAGGMTNSEIANELFLSVRTVERHIGNVYGKINARGRADATAYALTHHLV